MSKTVRLIAGMAMAAALASMAAAQLTAPTKVIGFMTDFDVKDDAVGICKAVMDGIAPGVRILDITHQSEPYNIAMGARFLAGSAPYFPKDAVFVVVIDPTRRLHAQGHHCQVRAWASSLSCPTTVCSRSFRSATALSKRMRSPIPRG